MEGRQTVMLLWTAAAVLWVQRSQHVRYHAAKIAPWITSAHLSSGTRDNSSPSI